MRTVRRIAELRAALEPLRGGSIGLVPTMGAFHAGHQSLFAAADAECDCAVASLFVNPAQFDTADDLAGYPRDEATDERIAAEARVDVLFAPAAAELYPEGFQTWVEVEELSRPLEGEFRPGHFRGVATICLKLFNLVRPRRAYFGQKDAQQAAVIQRLVRDLNLDGDLTIRVLPTVRDADGLALSSRNAKLTAADRKRALVLPRALDAGAAAHRAGEDPVAAARAGLDRVPTDYVAVTTLEGRRVLAAAIRIGATRLIDNVILDKEAA